LQRVHTEVIRLHFNFNEIPDLSADPDLHCATVLWIRIRIHMFLGLPNPEPDPLVRGMDPDPDPSIIIQK
jgi:hypothetical protein